MEEYGFSLTSSILLYKDKIYDFVFYTREYESVETHILACFMKCEL